MGFGVATGTSPKQKICSQRNVCCCLAYALVRHGVASENLLCPFAGEVALTTACMWENTQRTKLLVLFFLFFFSFSFSLFFLCKEESTEIKFGEGKKKMLPKYCDLSAACLHSLLFWCNQRMTRRIFVWLHLVWKIRPKECHRVFYLIGIKLESMDFFDFFFL